MDWLDKVFLAKYDQETNNVASPRPYYTEPFFSVDELETTEAELAQALSGKA